MDFPVKKIDLSTANLIFVEQESEFFNESITVLCLLRSDSTCEVTGRDWHGFMKPGDLVLWKEPETFHLSCRSRSLFLVIFLDYLHVREEFGEDFNRLECNSLLHPELSYENVRRALIRLALAHTSNYNDNYFYIRHHMYGFFHVLKAEFLILPHRSEALGDLSKKQADRLEQFTGFVSSNYRSPLTLQNAADYMQYTPQYLANFLKKHLGFTFNEYLTRVRLDSAVLYLKYRNYSVEQIVFLSGFANTVSFRKAFEKTYGITPEDFRRDFACSRQHKSDPYHFVSDPNVVKEYLNNSLSGSSRPLTAIESSEKRTVSCDVTHTSPIRPVWRELINLGSAENFESPAFREHITMMQGDLSFRYGRITNILSLVSIYYTESGRYIYNFSRIFSTLDFLLNLGLRPFLELGDKAGNIYLPTGNVTVHKSDFEQAMLPKLIEEFLRSCIDYYGFEELSLWKFELWMRYKTSSMLRLESPANYFQRFETIDTIIKTLLPGAQVGAPGFNTYASFHYLEQTLQYFDRKHLHPDFISIYLYPFTMPPVIEDEENVPIILTEDPDFFRHRVRNVKKILARCHMEDLPVYVTEFSTYIARNNYFNDTSYQASFLVKQYLENGSETAAMGYWLASETAAEYPDNTEFLFGGNGLISPNGIKKPGYHALSFLFSLGSDLVAQGENYIITHSIDDNYQMLFYNYAHFTSDFCRNPEHYEITKYPDRAFLEVPAKQFRITLRGLTAGTYKITRYTVSNDHGSAFHEWRKLDFVQNMNQNEIRHFQNICVPEMYVFSCPAEDTLTLKETVEKNEVLFINIEKIC